jgi:hypothetical protein
MDFYNLGRSGSFLTIRAGNGMAVFVPKNTGVQMM